MILHHASYQGTQCAELISTYGLGYGVVVPSEQTYNAMMRRIDSLSTRIRHVDFQWYRDVAVERDWIEDTYGLRDNLISSTALRQSFIQRTAAEIPGPLFSLTGPVNDGARAREYAREMVRLRDAQFPGRPVYASFVVDRQGLSDNSTLASLNPIPRGVDGVALTVQDVASYPSVWTERDWYGWLRLVRGFVSGGYEVVVPFSDVRGIVALGVGANELGSGPQQDLRQLRPAQRRQSSTGAQPAVSYLSLPLLSIVHGARASVDADWTRIETHQACSSFLGRLAQLHSQSTSFDESWMSTGRPQGELTENRIEQHISALASAEAALVASNSRADAMEQQLEHAAQLGQVISEDLFKNPGSRTELQSRLDAFRRVRRDLAF